jgi:predicted enzyme related to lactoylglutathione lyase
MAQVIGVGGVFFKCDDPERLAGWYARHLGMSINDFGGVAFQFTGLPQGAYCVWGPFAADTTYFEPTRKSFMINLMVDDLDGALAQVRDGGAEIVGEVEAYEYGRFGWFIDPEGNKVELWEPDRDRSAASDPH